MSPTLRSYITGTVAYRAPELLRGESPTAKADIYSLGITLWEMTSREAPFNGQNKHYVIFAVVARNLRPLPVTHEVMEDVPDKCYNDVYMQCWNADPAGRPTAEELLEMFEMWKNCL